MQKDLGYYDELRSGVGSSMFRVCKFIMTEKIVMSGDRRRNCDFILGMTNC